MGDNRTVSLDGRYWALCHEPISSAAHCSSTGHSSSPTISMKKEGLGDKLSFYTHVILHFFDQTRWRRTLHLVR